MWNEAQGHKGANEVTSCFKNMKPKDAGTLYLFSDGGIRHDKNITMVQNLTTLLLGNARASIITFL
jgi:hypothetical protein